MKECIGSVTELTPGFAGLNYISFAGLRVLLPAHKTMNRKSGMRIGNVNGIVQEAFAAAGSADILTIE